MGRPNHRGWVVLRSIRSTDASLCVDFFRVPGEGYGFEHFRSDPEDRGRWTAVGGFGAQRFTEPNVAAQAAAEAVSWLVDEREARQLLETWIAESDRAG